MTRRPATALWAAWTLTAILGLAGSRAAAQKGGAPLAEDEVTAGQVWGPLRLPAPAPDRPSGLLPATSSGIAVPSYGQASPQPPRGASTLGGLPVFGPLLGAASQSAPAQAGAGARDPAAARPTQAKVEAAKLCKTDRECPAGKICERGECVKLRTPINVLYLFYRSASRRYTSVLGLYHHRHGLDGFRVVAPIYFHFWNPRHDTRVVAPLFVGHHNKTTGRKDTFFLNFHHVSSPKGTQFNVWPILFTTSYPKRGFDFTLFPLFHYGRKEARWSVYSILPLPFYAHRDPSVHRFFVLPFTGASLSKERSFVWAAPLNFYHRVGQTKRWFFFPFYYGSTDRQGERHQSVLFPFFYYSRLGNHRHRLVSLLFSWTRDRVSGSSTTAWFLPPMVFSRDRERRLNLVFPLYLGYENRLRGSSLHVVPPFALYRDARQTNAALLPIFYYFKDRQSGAYSTLLFPLFYRHRSATGNRLTIFTPFFLEQQRSSWRTGVFPLLWLGSGERASHAVLFPLFWRFADKKKSRSFTILGNVFVSRGPGSYSFGVLPLVFGGRSQAKSHAVVFPLFWHRVDREKNRAFTVVGPSFWWRNKDDWGHGTFPIYWFKRWYSQEGYVSSSLFVFPLLYRLQTPKGHLTATPLGGYSENFQEKTRTGVVLTAFWHSSPRRRSMGVLPFFGYEKNLEKRSSTYYFFPLNFLHRTPTSSATVLFPLLWHFKDPKRRALVVAPLFWHVRQVSGWNADILFPLFFRLQKGKHRVLTVGPFYQERTADQVKRVGLFPLLHMGWDKKTAYGHFLPLVFHYRNRVKGTGVTVAGPFYTAIRERSRHSGVVPLAFWGRSGKKRYAVGMPFVWHFADPTARKSTTFVGPLFWHRRGEVVGGGLAPLLWFQTGPGRKQATIFPLLHAETRPGRLRLWTPLFGFGWDRALGSNHGYVGPVYWDRTPTTNAQVVFPLFWRYASHKARTSTTVVFPLFYGKHSPEERFHVLFPLVWRHSTVTRNTLLVLPLFYDSVTHHESRTTALFPFFFRHKVHHRNDTTWIFPPSLYVRQRPGKLDLVLFPLLWHHQRPNRRSSVFFPLYWDFQRPGGKRSIVGFPLYWDFRRPGYRGTVFFPLFWRFERGSSVRMVVLNSYIEYDRPKKTWQYMFLPLFDVARRRPGDIRFSLLGGLVGYERIGRNRRLKLFWAPIRLKPLPGVALAPSAPPSSLRAATWDPF
ncbi:MAG: hypothetical protein RBU30_04820 [Polyangia bacterium]|nr:hypothetical protein [Polyangia bacterium]